jgi:alkylation response protein AidB-like acyl-CoA dehydrogenase
MIVPPLEPLAGIGVAYAQREEAEPEGQHDDVQHEMLLLAIALVGARAWRVAGKADGDESKGRSDRGPRITRNQCSEVPLAAYVFEKAKLPML